MPTRYVTDNFYFGIHANRIPCVGEDVPLHAQIQSVFLDSTFLWTGPNGFRSEKQDTLIENITEKHEGWYYLRVTGGHEPIIDSAYIRVRPFPEVSIQITGEASFCAGDSVALSVDPQEPDFRYEWSTGSDEPSIVVKESGTYTVWVSNENDCEVFRSVEIIDHDAPRPEIVITGESEFCDGDSAVLACDTEFPFYMWTRGGDTLSNDGSITVTQAGVYRLTVKDENGCSGYAETEIIVNPNPEFEITGLTEACEGDTLLLGVAADSWCSYQWSNGEWGEEIEISEPGIYWAKATNHHGCCSYDTFEVTFHPKPQINIDGETDICEGETTKLTAECDISGCSLSWSTGVIRESIVVGASGTYSVIAESAFGCRDTASVTVEVHPLPQVKIVGDTVFCYGESLKLNAEPVIDTWQYEWSDGSAGPEITITAPGEYYVTVTDARGCSGSDKIEVRYYEIVLDDVREILFESIIVGNSADEPLSFTNRGDEITIESISLKEGTAFSVVSSPGTPVSLGKDENIDLTVTFAPPAAGAFTDTLLVRIPAPCDTSIRIALSGTGIQPDFLALIRLPDTVATIGDPAYNIPLRARMLSDTMLNLSYTAEISFDATLMLPEERFTQRTEGGRRFVNLSGGPCALGTAERQIGAITGSIFLPQNEISDLRIESFAFDKEYVRDSLINGSIQVEGICEPGLSQIKLMQPEFSIYPNPAEGEASITIQSEEEGVFELSIYTIEGVRKEYHNWTQRTDETSREIILDLKEWSVGVYPAILRTPGKVIKGMVYVVR